jgi:rod shape-determining protein MreD
MKILSLTAAPVFGPRDFLKVAAFGLFLVIVEGFLAAWLGLIGYGPEWMLVLTIYVALRSELWVTVLAAFLLGFFRDALGGFMLGLWPLTLIMVAWLFHPSRLRLNFFHPLTLMPLIFMLSLGGYLLIMTPVMTILGWPGSGFNPLPAFLVSSLVTALTAPPLFSFMDWLTNNKDLPDG